MEEISQLKPYHLQALVTKKNIYELIVEEELSITTLLQHDNLQVNQLNESDKVAQLIVQVNKGSAEARLDIQKAIDDILVVEEKSGKNNLVNEVKLIDPNVDPLVIKTTEEALQLTPDDKSYKK